MSKVDYQNKVLPVSTFFINIIMLASICEVYHYQWMLYFWFTSPHQLFFDASNWTILNTIFHI